MVFRDFGHLHWKQPSICCAKPRRVSSGTKNYTVSSMVVCSCVITVDSAPVPSRRRRPHRYGCCRCEYVEYRGGIAHKWWKKSNFFYIPQQYMFSIAIEPKLFLLTVRVPRQEQYVRADRRVFRTCLLLYKYFYHMVLLLLITSVSARPWVFRYSLQTTHTPYPHHHYSHHNPVIRTVSSGLEPTGGRRISVS